MPSPFDRGSISISSISSTLVMYLWTMSVLLTGGGSCAADEGEEFGDEGALGRLSSPDSEPS